MAAIGAVPMSGRGLTLCAIAALGTGVASAPVPANGQEPQPVRASTDNGSLLIWSNVEVKWDLGGNVIQDTFLTLTNDYPEDVLVQLYFVNGDAPRAYDPATGERSHRGWNRIDNQIRLTGDESAYWSAVAGQPKGVSPWPVLDWGQPPGRPDPDDPTVRTLRGFVMAWAVDFNGHEIRWNHLSGAAVLIDYAAAAAWEYNALSFLVVAPVPQGAEPDAVPGRLELNGQEYAAAFGRLLLDFYATGADVWSGTGTVLIDTELTLLPLSADLRQDGRGAIATKADFDIWNMNEVRFSNTHRCVTCWNQTPLGDFPPPNSFRRENLQTDRGKARIDGVASIACSGSLPVPLAGVAVKLLDFATTTETAGDTLVGQGWEPAVILYDLTTPPDELRQPRKRPLLPRSRVGPTRQP